MKLKKYIEQSTSCVEGGVLNVAARRAAIGEILPSEATLA